jgi:hypothetical protein
MNIEDLLSSEVCECCVGGRKWSELAVGRVAEGLVKVHGMVAVAEAACEGVAGDAGDGSDARVGLS